MFLTLAYTLSLFVFGLCANPEWVSLNVTVAQNMTDEGYMWSQVPVLIGTPPQPMDLTIVMGGTLLAAWSSECPYCPGNTLFDMSASTTLRPDNAPWLGNTNTASGMWYHDSVSFGGTISASDINFVAMQFMSINYPSRALNGALGLSADPAFLTYPSVWTKMWEAGSLMNPVIGMRLDPLKPRLTIGALDPEDFVGEINWVEIQSSSTVASPFTIDGLKGYNGSFLPIGVDKPLTSLDSLSFNIYAPPSNPYALHGGFTGPVHEVNLYPDVGGFAFQCNSTADGDLSMPQVHFTVTINGVDYPMDSAFNMIRPPSMFSALGFCNVAIRNTTASDGVDVVLGLPFLRSVYVAYRFPTDNCPGYYGFGFPSGANRTQEQINQKPTSTPSLSNQCLVLTPPTSTPSVAPFSYDKKNLGTGAYKVYGEDEEEVPLLNPEDLMREAWNKTIT